MSLLLHCGGQPATMDELDLLPVPQETDSYKPVPHYDLADKLKTIGQDILTDYTLIGEDYGLAREGNQLFAVLKFQKDNSEMALSIGFRNSYDRSMSIGIAIGANVFVCDNLMLSGEIAVMKRHTKNVWNGLEDLAITTVYKSEKNYNLIQEDTETMKRITLTNEHAFMYMGLLYGDGIISPRQLPVLKEQWLKPTHDEFQARNLWSLYNGATHALKTTPPNMVMEKHVKLHDALNGLPF